VPNVGRRLILHSPEPKGTKNIVLMNVDIKKITVKLVPPILVILLRLFKIE